MWNISLVVGFLATLVAPTVASVFGLRPWDDIDEKRALATKPEAAPWSRAGLRNLPTIAQDWEKYFVDNFGFRKVLIGAHRLLTFHLLHASLNPSVVVGESDGERRWLYFDASVTGDGVGLESILGHKPYAPAALAAIAGQLRQIVALAESRGARLVIVIAPDKQTIYPEYLPPDRRPRPGAVSRLDQFWAMAGSLPSVPLVDLREGLRRAKRQQQLYYPSDTHWNWRGGLLAYVATARRLARQDPSWQVPAVERLRWFDASPRVGDLTTLMGLPAIGGDRDELPTRDSLDALVGSKRGKLLLVADSFGEALQIFFDLQFQQVSTRRVTRGACEALTPALLDAEKPDVVILQSAERYWTMD
ncbi:MAG: hypothetical protein JXP73_06215 [Deltaproteobacteria bacterium]|nr:hypothetical protein [Deltaproteobacteria bacterium]